MALKMSAVVRRWEKMGRGAGERGMLSAGHFADLWTMQFLFLWL